MKINFDKLPTAKQDRETTINWVATDTEVSICTSDRLTLRKLEKANRKPESITQYGDHCFTIPLKSLSLRKDKAQSNIETVDIDFDNLPESKYERETAISWLATDETAIIYTDDRIVLRKLLNNGSIPYRTNDFGGYFFKLSLNCISFRKNSSRTMSEENKEKARQRMKDYHKNKVA